MTPAEVQALIDEAKRTGAARGRARVEGLAAPGALVRPTPRGVEVRDIRPPDSGTDRSGTGSPRGVG